MEVAKETPSPPTKDIQLLSLSHPLPTSTSIPFSIDNSLTPPSTASSSTTSISNATTPADSQPNTPDLIDNNTANTNTNTNGDNINHANDANTATTTASSFSSANTPSPSTITATNDNTNDTYLDNEQDQDATQSDGSGSASGSASASEDDEDNENTQQQYVPKSPLRLSKKEIDAGITICTKNNMKVDKYNYGKSKNGKAGNAEREGNPLMTLLPSSIEGRPDTIAVAYPPYIGKLRDCGEQGSTQVETNQLYFKIGAKVHEYNCVRNSWLRAGFVRTNTWSKAVGYWGQHCSAQAFRNLNKYQKVNHFPGSWCIGNKARLGKIMGRMRRMHGSKEFHIHAETLCMPMDRRKLANMITSEPRALWIIKPANSSCGRGIRVTSSQSLNPKKMTKGSIVQRYLSNPYLIGGRKFDMRIYIIVTSYDPLRAYLCEEGLVRFATGKYSKSLKSLKNRFVSKKRRRSNGVCNHR
jgi:hypothetical protein|tara:strand:- start:57 stop:1466 length:1410 start_codon:yes stop_codon:yes gene_type:complete